MEVVSMAMIEDGHLPKKEPPNKIELLPKAEAIRGAG